MPPKKARTVETMARTSSEKPSFLTRSHVFLRELEMQMFPNASKLARLCACSRSTAMRTIDTLRKEFGVPIQYDESNRGYRLTDANYRFASLPHTRAEIIALLLAAVFTEALGDSLLTSSLRTLVDKLTLGRHDVAKIRRKLPKLLTIKPLQENTTQVSSIEALSLCLDGSPIRLTIPRDSKGTTEETIVGIPRQLIIKDFAHFLVVECASGKTLTIPAQSVSSSYALCSTTHP